MPPNTKIYIQINQAFYESIEKDNLFYFAYAKDHSVKLEYKLFSTLAQLLSFVQKEYGPNANFPAKFLTPTEYEKATLSPKVIPDAVYLKNQYSEVYWVSVHSPSLGTYSFRKLNKDGTPMLNHCHSGHHDSLSAALESALKGSCSIIPFSKIKFNNIID